MELAVIPEGNAFHNLDYELAYRCSRNQAYINRP